MNFFIEYNSCTLLGLKKNILVLGGVDAVSKTITSVSFETITAILSLHLLWFLLPLLQYFCPHQLHALNLFVTQFRKSLFFNIWNHTLVKMNISWSFLFCSTFVLSTLGTRYTVEHRDHDIHVQWPRNHPGNKF